MVQTFVLIPGAGGDPWYWHLVERELLRRGHEVVAVALPASDDGAGWVEYVDAVVRAAQGRSDIVLVAQSFGGFTAPLVCNRLDVSLLVFVNATIPRVGELPADWGDNTGRWAAQREHLLGLGFAEEAAEDGKRIYWHDVPEALLAEASGRDGRQSATPWGQPLPSASGPLCRFGCSSDGMTVCSRPDSSDASPGSGWALMSTRCAAVT
jgi:hypothetical protein